MQLATFENGAFANGAKTSWESAMHRAINKHMKSKRISFDKSDAWLMEVNIQPRNKY